jgi:hypothetical protein
LPTRVDICRLGRNVRTETRRAETKVMLDFHMNKNERKQLKGSKWLCPSSLCKSSGHWLSKAVDLILRTQGWLLYEKSQSEDT